MIIAFDTYYFNEKAKTVGLSFNNWNDLLEQSVHTEIIENVTEYTSGEFYKRELPCILSLSKTLNLHLYETIVVDGFVYLDDNGKYGLGGHLYETLGKSIPIIGVAKTDFISLTEKKRKLLRGESIKPLYVTAIGMDIDEAAEKIQFMSGDFRIPTLLKKLDTITKVKSI